MNKKSQAGREWILGISMLFSITIIYLTFNLIYNAYLAPTLIKTMPNTSDGALATAGITSWLTTWQYIPYILIGILLIYLVIVSVRREPTQQRFG